MIRRPIWVLFDAADTLLMPRPSVASVYQRVAAEHGSEVTVEEIEQRFKPAIGKHFADDVSNEAADRRRWRELVFDVLETTNDDVFHAIWNHFSEAAHWQLFDDVAPTWSWLVDNGFRVAIASNFDQRLNNIVHELPPIQNTERVFISSQLGYRKPSGRFFAAIERQLEAEPSDLLLVGDSLESDYNGASNAGWQALLVDRSLPKDSLPKLNRLTSLLALLA